MSGSTGGAGDRKRGSGFKEDRGKTGSNVRYAWKHRRSLSEGRHRKPRIARGANGSHLRALFFQRWCARGSLLRTAAILQYMPLQRSKTKCFRMSFLSRCAFPAHCRPHGGFAEEMKALTKSGEDAPAGLQALPRPRRGVPGPSTRRYCKALLLHNITEALLKPVTPKWLSGVC